MRTRFLTGFSRKLALSIKNGAVGVLPTDTIYGIVGSAFSFSAVSRIYKLRKRRPDKPFIVLISSLSDLKPFGVAAGKKTGGILGKVWPGKVSVLLPVSGNKFRYIHRGTKRIAFRLPAKKELREFLAVSGPVVAPSANWEGKPPAENIREARRYFGEKSDFYLDKGTLKSSSSTLAIPEGGKLRVIRQGAVKIAKSIAL
jgi:L-threonylcarbamoyladenylate synthase